MVIDMREMAKPVAQVTGKAVYLDYLVGLAMSCFSFLR
jgi:hypothetical protein